MSLLVLHIKKGDQWAKHILVRSHRTCRGEVRIWV